MLIRRKDKISKFSEPRVVTVMREYREAMKARELEIMRDMAKRWLMIENRVNGDIAALQLTMAQKAASGKVITQQMIWREERYQILKGNLAEAIRGYNRDYLAGTISDAQKEFGWFGVQAAADSIRASYALKIAPEFKVLNREAVETMAGLLSNGSPLNTLLKNEYPEALDGLTDALIHGVARGASSGQVAVEMANGLGMGLERAITIASTEMNRTYRSAITQEYRESNVVTGFRRLVLKAGACMACLFLDGEKFDVASDLDDHPRGHCQAVPEVIGVGAPQWEKGADWFKGLDADEQEEKLGPELFEKWQKEGFDLSSLVSKSHSDEWGDTPRFNAGGG